MSFKLANYRTVTLAAQPLSYFLKWHCHLLEKLKLCFQIFHLERNFKSKREVKYKSQQSLKFEALGVAEMLGFGVEMAAQLFDIRGLF